MARETPKHYAFSIEPIDAIASWGLNFNCGNVVKYVARAGIKDPAAHLVDLQKAADYLSHEIERVKNLSK